MSVTSRPKLTTTVYRARTNALQLAKSGDRTGDQLITVHDLLYLVRLKERLIIMFCFSIQIDDRAELGEYPSFIFIERDEYKFFRRNKRDLRKKEFLSRSNTYSHYLGHCYSTG